MLATAATLRNVSYHGFRDSARYALARVFGEKRKPLNPKWLVMI